MQLDRRLSFGEHLRIATAKAIQCGADLTRLMPNIGGPKEDKRRLVASVVNSKLLYTAPVWISALNNHAIQKKLFVGYGAGFFDKAGTSAAQIIVVVSETLRVYVRVESLS